MSMIFRLGDTIKKKIHALVGTKIKGSYLTTVIGVFLRNWDKPGFCTDAS